jgi:uncharacterized protein
MFRVNLRDLDRVGSLRLEGEIAPDDPLWSEMTVGLGAPVRVSLTLTATPSGQVLARGTLTAETRHECRRCLAPVARTVELPLDMIWTVPDELGDEDDGELRFLEPSSNELEIGEAIREEFLLAVPRYVVCREDCAGLCPRCGTNRNEGACACSVEEPDPRWDALRTLKTE